MQTFILRDCQMRISMILESGIQETKLRLPSFVPSRRSALTTDIFLLKDVRILQVCPIREGDGVKISEKFSEKEKNTLLFSVSNMHIIHSLCLDISGLMGKVFKSIYTLIIYELSTISASKSVYRMFKQCLTKTQSNILYVRTF